MLTVSFAGPLPVSPSQFDATNVVENLDAVDLDGDGDLDVLSTNPSVQWYENTDGAGSMAPRQLIDPFYLDNRTTIPADLDGDGDQDVLSGNFYIGFSWYENTDGNGTFGPDTLIDNWWGDIRSVTDVDGDGDQDLLGEAYVSDGSHWNGWYENDGTGQFRRVPDQSESRIDSAVDLDGDGDLDLLRSRSGTWRQGAGYYLVPGWIDWLENRDGAWHRRIIDDREFDSSVDASPKDIDGDGDLDVLALYTMEMSGPDFVVAWYENTDGAGNFGPERVIRGLDDVDQAADLDGDGDLDLLANSANGQVWYENVGGLETFGPVHVIDVLHDVDGFVDFDGDGDLDLLGSAGNGMAWLENADGRGSFKTAQWFPGLDQIEDVVDMDGDGDMDLLSSRNWYVNDGAGIFSFPRGDESRRPANFVTTADVNGDGNLDVISASRESDQIAWYENALADRGVFSSRNLITSSADGPESVFAADLDRDGDVDLLAASGLDDTIAWYENTGGGFGEPLPVGVPPASPRVITDNARGAASVSAADLDRDGDLDVLAASRLDDTIAWYENLDGKGAFGPPQVISASADGATSVVAADLDDDGDLDVLSASSEDNQVAWYENSDGAGSFGSPRVITDRAAGARSVFAADVDGDGDRDVLVASSDDHTIAWYENTDGAGAFGLPIVLSTTAKGASSVFADDLDGDGDLDVLSASSQGHTIAWYENTDGSGAFGPPRVVSDNRNGAESVLAADLDADGRLDVVSASASGLDWYRANDHGHDADRATVVSVPSTTPGRIQRPTEADWFVFSAVEGTSYFIETILGSLRDTELRLVDSDRQTRLAFDDDQGTHFASALLWQAESSGDVFLEVAAGEFGDRVGTYGLRIVVDHGNDAAGATALTVPSTTTGEIQTVRDEDWFVLSATEGTEYEFQMTSPSDDWVLRIYDSDGHTQLATALPIGNGTDGSLVWQADSSADVFVQVALYDVPPDVRILPDRGVIASYRLIVSQTEDGPMLVPGDSDGNGRFDQRDIIQALNAGKYLTGQPADWSEGDWNGDGVFDQSDVRAALETGLYLQGPYALSTIDAVFTNIGVSRSV